MFDTLPRARGKLANLRRRLLLVSVAQSHVFYTMSIFHVPTGYFPEPVGGTEVYVTALAHALAKGGRPQIIVAPGDHAASYTHEGLPVRRFAVAERPLTLEELYGSGDPVAATGFAALLNAEKPDLVHFHALPSLHQLRALDRLSIPSLYTYHLPASCPRHTLLYNGHTACDGRLEPKRCTSCVLRSKGIGPLASSLISALPPTIGRAIGVTGQAGGIWTALRMPELLRLRAAAIHEVLSGLAAVVVLCDWARAVLIRNGMSASRLHLSRHGIIIPTTLPPLPALSRTGRTLRVAFVGRLTSAKGVHILTAALRTVPQAYLQLDLFALDQNEARPEYRQRIVAEIAFDPRIRLCEPLPNHAVVPTLRGYDILAVPSQWLETGPLVVLEAFAAGIPVLGSNLGGVSELVRHDVDGLLLPHADPTAWGRALVALSTDSANLSRLRTGVRPPRSMAEVAAEMTELYASLHDSTLPQSA